MTNLDRKRRKRISTSLDDKPVSTAKKRRERIGEDNGEYSSSPSPPRLKEDLFEPGGPQVGPKTEAIVKGNSSSKKRKTVSVTIELHLTETKKNIAKGDRIDGDDLGEEPGSTLSSAEYSFLVNERRKRGKRVDTVKKRQVIESDSDSNSDDSDISTPWLKKERKRNLDGKVSQASTPPTKISRKVKSPLMEEMRVKDIPKKIKKNNNHKSSLDSDKDESKASTSPLKIPRRKISNVQPDQEFSVPLPTFDIKIAKKDVKLELKSNSLIANIVPAPKKDKSSFLKFPPKPSPNIPNAVRTEEKLAQPNWRSGVGLVVSRESHASRSKMNPPQQRHQSTWISQPPRQHPQLVQKCPLENNSPTKRPLQLRDSVSENILKDLDKIIHKVLSHHGRADLRSRKVEQLESLGMDSNNKNEFGSNNRHTEEDEEEERYDFFDRNDDGSIIIDNATPCGDSKVGHKDLPLMWWGILSPPDHILSMHNRENKERRIVTDNAETFFPHTQHHQRYGNGSFNNPPHPQGHCGGRELEGQKFVDGGRNAWKNRDMRNDWGNGRGRDLHRESGRGGSGDRYLNTTSFDRGRDRRSNRREGA